MALYEKHENGSYMHNCHVVPRAEDRHRPIVCSSDDDGVTVMLNGYAIIPLEEYAKLADRDIDVDQKAILLADDQLS